MIEELRDGLGPRPHDRQGGAQPGHVHRRRARGRVREGERAQGVLEALRDHVVVHARRDNVKQVRIDHALARESRNPHLIRVVAPYYAMVIHSDHAKFQRIQRIVVELVNPIRQSRACKIRGERSLHGSVRCLTPKRKLVSDTNFLIGA